MQEGGCGVREERAKKGAAQLRWTMPMHCALVGLVITPTRLRGWAVRGETSGHGSVQCTHRHARAPQAPSQAKLVAAIEVRDLV